MRMKKLVSIIVPIYKVEPYLKKCIDSIINQTYKNLEIILVDDGSPDNCGEICDYYKQVDERIVVIHKENDGVSNARNSGMQVAHGDYFYFIDGDDYAEYNAIEILVDLAEKESADLVIAEINIVNEKENNMSEQDCEEELAYQVFSVQQAVDIFIEKDWGPWNKLYARHVHSNVEFPAHKIHEDEAIMLQLIGNSNKIVYTSRRLYNYLKRTGSTTSSVYSLKKMDWFEAWVKNVEYTCTHFPNAKDGAISKMIITAIYNLDNLLFLNTDEYDSQIVSILKCLKKFYFDILKSKKIKFVYKLRVIFAVFSVKWYKKVYKNRQKNC